MRWQRAAQTVIALLVIGFVVVLVMTLRKERVAPAQDPPPKRLDPANPVENPEGGQYQITDASGKPIGELAFGSHIGLPDGRAQLSKHVKFSIDRGNRHFVVESDEAVITRKDALPEHAVFKGNVRVTGSGGLELETSEATYTDADGMITIPGALEFTKERMRGSGVGATYDQNREVLWILDQAKIAVDPGQDGLGGLDGTATTIGLARADHYLVLEGAARIEREGRVTEANQITIRLSEDDERVQMLELRDRSRIAGGQGGPQAMSATDIDLTYADDGRTLQFAKLVENAVVQLPGEGGAGRRIAGNAIDIALGPDGTAVTNLTANERVQVDLPAEGQSPAKRIKAASLMAVGAPGAGLQNATFAGGVEYVETRAAGRGVAAVNRQASSLKLLIETKPGLGALEKADFRGNVTFRDAPDFKAEAMQGIYHIAGDRLELMPADGEPGPSAHVTDGRLSVQARTIAFVLSSREMRADTRVRSTILAETSPRARGGEARIPSMLAQDQEVNVTSNRLHYKGSSATYSGDVKLWQGTTTTIKAGSIVIEEKSGNLTASEGVATVFLFEEVDPKTGSRKPAESTGRAEAFSYDDAKRLATYTGKAQLQSTQGHLTGERILLFMKADHNELERTEAFGTNGSVVVRDGARIGKGNYLKYTAADDTYFMTGTPVEVVEETQGTCRITLGASLKFSHSSETAQVDGTPIFPHSQKTLTACPPELRRK
jgi:lipopolysaccharide transport protein LptA